MDTSSISPILNSPNGGHYFKELKILRKDLVSRLKLYYTLEEFDVFIMPSVTYAILALKHIIDRKKYDFVLGKHEHYLPIANLFSRRIPSQLDIDCCYKSELVTHVSPYSGKVNKLSRKAGILEVVDASHSFGTLIHEELINNSNVFVAPLHKHAGLSVGIAILAVRKITEISFLKNDLELFEASTSSKHPIIQAISALEENEAKLYNIASIRYDSFDDNNLEITSSKKNLPFICFKLDSPIDKKQINKINGSYFKHTKTIRISRWFQGSINSSPRDFSFEVKKDMKDLL